MNEEQRKTWNELSKGKSWTIKVISDPNNPGQSILTFSYDLVESIGWVDGDVLMCSILPEGRIILSKT